MSKDGRERSSHTPWWSSFQIRCPACGSTSTKDLKKLKYTWKTKKPLNKYECLECGNIFWKA